jgi:hypothetical protein
MGHPAGLRAGTRVRLLPTPIMRLDDLVLRGNSTLDDEERAWPCDGV